MEQPAEYVGHGFDDTHEVAEYIEEQVVTEIEEQAPPRSHKDYTFFKEQIDAARCYVTDKVIDEFTAPRLPADE